MTSHHLQSKIFQGKRGNIEEFPPSKNGRHENFIHFLPIVSDKWEVAPAHKATLTVLRHHDSPSDEETHGRKVSLPARAGMARSLDK